VEWLEKGWPDSGMVRERMAR